MKEQILKRSVSCVLTLCMLFLMLPVISLDVTAVGDEDVFQLDADCQVLKFVDEEVFNAADHVARLPEEETLDSYAFLNRDGTKTVYFLNENAKYYDATGAVKEKNIDLVAGLNAYTVTQNDVQLSIPADPASGIDMTYAGYDISLVPQGGSSTMVQHTDNSVGYINYYGKGTALLYTPTYSGIKEDILLAAYTGISSFTFLLNTDGLRLFSQNGRYFLAASADSDMQIRLGDVVAYDALCNMHRGTLTATAITEGQQYLLTVSVDDSFLTDESTVYPVVIDPTLTVSDETHGSNAIEDAPIFSYFPNVNHGSYIYNRVGYVNSNYGVGRTVIRPTGLLNSSVYQNLSIDQIASATFHIRDASGSGSATVNLHPLTNSTWTESGVTWNNVGYHSSVSYATASVGGNTMAAFDITSLVGEWKLGIKNPQCGFILISANESTSQRALVSSEGAVGAPGYYPYIALTYTNYTNDSVSVREGYSTAMDTSGLTGPITWTVNDSSVATVSASGVVTGVKAGKTYVTAWVNGVEAKSYAIYVIIPDGLYSIMNLDAEYYLGVKDGIFSTGANLELQDRATSGYTRLQQLWNVKYVNNGTYEISALFYDDPCLQYIGGQVSLSTSSSVLNHWMISYADGGYRIQKILVEDAYLCPEDSCVSEGTTICTDSIANVGSSTLWDFERQTNVVGVVLCDTDTYTYATSSTLKYVGLGQTISQASLGIEYYFYSTNTYETQHEWDINNANVASIDPVSGQVIGNALGSAVITIYIDDDSGDCLTASYNIVVTGLAPGRYGIQNYYSKRYAGAQSAAKAAPLYQDTLQSKELQIWELVYAGDEYYYISLDKHSNLYLGVNGMNVALYNGKSGDNTKWKITLVLTDSDGRHAYILSPKANEAYSLSLPSQTTSIYAQLQLKATASVTGNENKWYMPQLLPTSGCEIDLTSSYITTYWSSEVIRQYINCYGYAIDNQIDFTDMKFYVRQQPGNYSGTIYAEGDPRLYNPTEIIAAAKRDFDKYGVDNSRTMIFTEIGRYEQCPAGTYKVALVISPNDEYHWYRQDGDGFWSSKLPTYSISKVDAALNYIIDPQAANLGKYTSFVGYFAITPWSRYYSPSDVASVTEITVHDYE